MRWLVATAVLAGGCDALFNLDHLKAPLVDSGRQETDAPTSVMDSALVDAAEVVLDAPPDVSSDTTGCAISYGASRYQFKNFPYSWAMADSYCKSLQVPASMKYSHLAVVDDSTDLAVIANAAGSSAAFVGLSFNVSQSRWDWITSQNVPVTVWASNEPDNTGGCGLATAAGLDDVTCAETHGFVCECDNYAPN